MKTATSFTLHDVEPELYTALLAQARSHDTSLNRIAKAMLRAATGLGIQKKKRDLSWIGAHQWTKAETKAFDKAIRETEKIVPGDW